MVNGFATRTGLSLTASRQRAALLHRTAFCALWIFAVYRPSAHYTSRSHAHLRRRIAFRRLLDWSIARNSNNARAAIGFMDRRFNSLRVRYNRSLTTFVGLPRGFAMVRIVLVQLTHHYCSSGLCYRSLRSPYSWLNKPPTQRHSLLFFLPFAP